MKFTWPESARAELRRVDRESAVRILLALTRYGESGEGDIKALSGEGCSWCASFSAGGLSNGPSETGFFGVLQT
jgi:hypothetical protein